MTLPVWRYRWAAWMLGHNHPDFDYRPYGRKNPSVRPGPPVPPVGMVPENVRLWYLAKFAAEIATPHTHVTAATTTVSPFAGRGCLTAHDPLVLIREGLVGCFDWIAVKGDGGDAADPNDVVALNYAASAKWIHVWYACDGSTRRLLPSGFDGVICQAEGPAQYDLAMDVGFGLTKRALVTNNYLSVFPTGWDVLAEAYWNVVAASSPGSVVSDSLNRGARNAYPCFGVGSWGEAYRTVPLADYVAAWGPTNWSVYLGELLRPEDIAWLKAYPR